MVLNIVDKDSLLRLRYCMVDDRRSVDHAVVNVAVENHDMILIVSCDESFDDASLSCLFVFIFQTVTTVYKFCGKEICRALQY